MVPLPSGFPSQTCLWCDEKARHPTPNQETQQAINELESGQGSPFPTVTALMNDLNKDDAAPS